MKIEIRILNKEFYDLDYGSAEEEHIIGPLPSYATPGSAAMDLICTEDITIYPQERVMIPTGLAIWIGSDVVQDNNFIGGSTVAGLILPRSGLGTKGLVLANTVGVIDEDYKSELMVSAWNSNKPTLQDLGYQGVNYYLTSQPQVIKLKAGDRFAQLMLMPVIKASWQIVDEFSDPTITREGFGSTGK